MRVANLIKSSMAIVMMAVFFCLGSAKGQDCTATEILFEFNDLALAAWEPYKDCEIFYGDILIGFVTNGQANTTLTDISFLENLREIHGDLRIIHADVLPTLKGLDNLERITGKLEIINNDELIDISAVDNISYVGGLQITSLLPTNFSIFNSLDSIADMLDIRNCDSVRVTSNTDFASLNYIGGYIHIRSNKNLKDLNFLSSLQNVKLAGGIGLISNSELTDISGLAGISEMSQIGIRSSPKLSFCSISSICNHLSSQGQFNFEDNSTGCNTEVEILNLCSVSTDNDFNNKNVILFPNPTCGKLFVSIENSKEISPLRLDVIDLNGNIIKQISMVDQNVIDLENVPSGIYIINIYAAGDERILSSNKIVKY